MGVEIERKFLVDDGGSWRASADHGTSVRQGYLSTGPGPGPAVRIRVRGDAAYLTIKGPTTGFTRAEYEYEIPVADATEMLDRWCERVIDKTRYLVAVGRHTWEIDEFHGADDGLVVAEVELSSEDEPFDMPDWARAEVTDDARYYNTNLVAHPFSTWT